MQMVMIPSEQQRTNYTSLFYTTVNVESSDHVTAWGDDAATLMKSELPVALLYYQANLSLFS